MRTGSRIPAFRARIGILAGLTIVVAATVWLLPPLPQPAAYHEFADQRTLFGIPRFLDVASNAGFLICGLLGLRLLAQRDRRSAPRFVDPRERHAWFALFLAVTLTSFGSVYYHLDPDNARLAWDRMPMAAGFAAFVAATAGERIGVHAGLRLLPPLVATGIGSVWYWRWSERQDAGDLLPYLAVQGWSLIAVLLLVAMFPARYSHGGRIVSALAVYAAALVAEYLDRAIFALVGVVSGHTVKHVLAAAAVYQIIRMLRDRRPI